MQSKHLLYAPVIPGPTGQTIDASYTIFPNLQCLFAPLTYPTPFLSFIPHHNAILPGPNLALFVIPWPLLSLPWCSNLIPILTCFVPHTITLSLPCLSLPHAQPWQRWQGLSCAPLQALDRAPRPMRWRSPTNSSAASSARVAPRLLRSGEPERLSQEGNRWEGK